MFSCDVDYINGNDDDVMMAVVISTMNRREVYRLNRELNVAFSHQ